MCPVILVLESGIVLLIDLLEHLVVIDLSVGLTVRVHLLLELKLLFKLLHHVIVVLLGLVTLGLQELELSLPESSLLVENIPLLLKLSLGSLELTSQLLVAVGIADLSILIVLTDKVVGLPELLDLSLVVGNQLLSLLLKV